MRRHKFEKNEELALGKCSDIWEEISTHWLGAETARVKEKANQIHNEFKPNSEDPEGLVPQVDDCTLSSGPCKQHRALNIHF